MTCFSVIGQSKQIQGIVIEDQLNSPLPGVSLLIKGTTTGTTTDFDGKYAIKVSEGDVLVFSYVGFKTQEITVGQQNIMNISMLEDMNSLDEVVIVGYGATKKINLTGAVATIDSKAIEDRPITTLSSGLSGLSPGLQVTQPSGGEAGNAGSTIRIRGIGTLNNSNPLILVDGIATGIGDFNPDDVESISVLKDAASASIYGSRAANGVILITTKKGKSGKLTVNYNTFIGAQNATDTPDFVNDYATYMELTNSYNGNNSYGQDLIDEWRDSNNPLTHPNEDWYNNQVGATRYVQSHNFSVAGGSDKSTFRLAIGFLDQDGLVVGNKLQRYNSRFNIESQIIEKIKVGGNIAFNWTELSPSISFNLGLHPALPSFRSPDGRWGGTQNSASGTTNNPNALIDNNVDDRRNQRVIGNLFFSYDILKGLNLYGSTSINYVNQFRKQFAKKFETYNFREGTVASAYPTQTSGKRTADVSASHNYLITNNLNLNYSKEFGKHNLKLLAGYETLSYKQENVGAGSTGFPNNEIREVSVGSEDFRVSGNAAEWTIQSYFGRLAYDYNEKYLFEANIRADGVSRFRDGKKWGYFPSFSAGWNISKESFLENATFLSNLKLRASWGQLGNSQIGNYPYQDVYDLNQNYTFNGQISPGIAQTSLSNQDITWETTTETDFGIDASFFKGALSITVDYYNRETSDILAGFQVPKFLGDKSNPTVNLATMVNKGWEFELGYQGNFGELKYGLTGNFAINDNNVTEYISDITTGRIQEGHPINSWFGYEAIDIFRTQEQLDNTAADHGAGAALGELEFVDQLTIDTDGDGIPDQADGVITPDDRKIIGDSNAQINYGASLNLKYRSFDFSVLVQGVANRDENYYTSGFQTALHQNRGYIHTAWLDAWSPDNPNGAWPRFDTAALRTNLTSEISSFWVRDVSYTRVKNIQLGYNMSKDILDKIHISRLRLFCSAENPFVFSNYELGYDPEVVDPSRIPNITTLSIGLNVTL